MHKVLTDAGIRLDVVVSDIHGRSALAMIKAILNGQRPHAVLQLASRRLKGSREALHDALQGELTASHAFVLDASRTKSAFPARLQASIVRRGHKRAIVALAHKMLRTIFFMLKRGEYCRDSATNHEQFSVQRNASRWIKALTWFGCIPADA